MQGKLENISVSALALATVQPLSGQQPQAQAPSSGDRPVVPPCTRTPSGLLIKTSNY